MIARLMEGAIERYRTTVAIGVLMTIAGIFAWSAIPVESEPNISVPVFAITIVHEGISPEDGERLIAMPLEAELRSVEGLKEMRAYALEGRVTVTAEFDVSYPVAKARTDIRDALDRAKPKFPLDTEEPWLNEFTTSDYPVIVINLSGDVPERVLYQLAVALRDDIESIPSVLQAELSGQRDELLEAIIQPNLLDSYGITMSDLATSVLRNNRLIAAGSLDTGAGRFSIKVPSVIEQAQDLFDIPIKSVNGTVVTVADIATIRRTFKDRDSYSRVNGIPAISVEVSKRADANLIDTVRQIRAVVERERASFPQQVRLFYTQDQTPDAQAQVTEMQGNIVAALAIVGAAVVAALGLRSGVIVAAAIPLAFLFGMIVVYLMGFSFNFMVMFGLLLGLGMIVDGSVVVTEYADRKMAEGVDRKDAYRLAATRMFPPVAASVATTLAAFLPLMFWPGIAGKFMSFLPVTVFAVLIGSLIYAMFFGPVFGAYFGKAHTQSDADKRDVFNLEQGDPRAIRGITGAYARIVDKLTGWPIATTLATFAIIAAVFWAYGQFGRGTTFFTEADPQFAQVQIRARGNLSADERRDLVQEVEAEALQIPGIEYMDSRSLVSSGGGGRRNAAPADLIGRIFMQFHEQQNREMTGQQIIEELRRRTAHLAGIEVNVQAQQQGPPTGKDIQIEFSSRQWPLVEQTLQKIREHMQSMSGIRDIDDTRPLPGVEWKLTVDRAKAAALGADVTSVGQAVQLVTNGIKIAEFRPDDAKDEVDIRVRYPSAERGLEALKTLRVPTVQGTVPASSFVRLTPTPRTDTIERVDGRRVMYLRANVGPGVLVDAKVRELQSWIAQQNFDPLVDMRFRGANEEQNNSMAFVFKAFLLALLLMFIMMIAQFNSLYQSILILVSIVMSTAGVLLGLLITDEPFSAILTGIGVVALAGIIVHNNIVLIDTYNQLRRDMPHESVHQSIVRTGAQRLRPVFLTVATCVLGLIPMAMHLSVDLINREVIYGGTVTSFWVPLARSICFGLSFATVLTLIVTPAMLALPQRLQDIVRTLFQRTGTAAAEPVSAPAAGAEGATIVALPERPRRFNEQGINR